MSLIRTSSYTLDSRLTRLASGRYRRRRSRRRQPGNSPAGGQPKAA